LDRGKKAPNRAPDPGSKGSPGGDLKGLQGKNNTKGGALAIPKQELPTSLSQRPGGLGGGKKGGGS